MKKIKRISLFPKKKDKRAIEVAQKTARWLIAKKIEVFVPQELSDRFNNIKKIKTAISQKLPLLTELAIVLGGDGTLLSVARLMREKSIPILGVNMGELGFITEITLDELYPVLKGTLKGRYEIDKRIMLEAQVLRKDKKVEKGYFALNDMVINKGALARIIDLEISVDKQYVNKMRADGLIVSTPTGSTAYCLAAGGPIIHPSAHSIALIPICPHPITNRPIILPNSAKIEIMLVSCQEEEVVLTVDGQQGVALELGDIVRIKKAIQGIFLIKSLSRNYFDIVRTKLKIGQP